MKPYVAIAASLAALASVQAHAAQTIQFPMTVRTAWREDLPCPTRAPMSSFIVFGDFENLEIVISGLPANTVFDFFIIQVPDRALRGRSGTWATLRPVGAASGSAIFIGRFSSETFIISPGVAPTVNKFPSPPAFVPEATTGIVTNPIQRCITLGFGSIRR